MSHTSTLAYEPQGFGNEPQGCGYEPQGLGYEPEGLGYEPQGIGYEPQGFGYEPQGFGYKPQWCGYQPQGFGYVRSYDRICNKVSCMYVAISFQSHFCQSFAVRRLTLPRLRTYFTGNGPHRRNH